MSNEIQRHERYKKYAYYAYHLDTAKFPKETIFLGVYQNPKTGFYGYALKENDRVIMVTKGTDKILGMDGINDFNMIIDKIPKQLTEALKLYDYLKTSYPNSKIDVTGHSLGGSITNYLSIMRNVNEAVAFNSVGIGKSMESYLIKYGSKTPEDNIINYNNPNDILTKQYRKKLFGKNYSVDSINKKGDNHSLENMKPLSTRTPGLPSFIPNDTFSINNTPLKMGIGVNVNENGDIINTYEYIDDTFNIEDIDNNINKNDSMKNQSKTLEQNITKSDSALSHNCNGFHTVNGYTRKDGTQVDGYTRKCGIKHTSNTSNKLQIEPQKFIGKNFQDLTPDEREEALWYFL